MEQSIARMKELCDVLRRASKAYYQDADEIMSNFEYDRLYDELVELEKNTGTVLSGSPTVSVGYEVLSQLPKERHESPMLSLNKTKSVDELALFAGEHRSLLSWKMDGLTVVLTYRDGELFKAVTRGNGEVGEVITPNAKAFVNVPIRIPYTGELILRGEAIITYSDFEKINAAIPDMDARYKNPRNLCSGSVRQLSSEVTAGRNVRFYAFSLVKADDVDFNDSRENQILWLKNQGFEIVEYRIVNAETMADCVAAFSEAIESNDFPSDGLVLLYDSISYGRSLGRTAKFPRDSIAFKWRDETALTHLLEVEWSASRTGLINPVAIFEPVELEGTTVSRASVHNVSIVKSLRLGIGDELSVYKANMIIPQIAQNLTESGNLVIPCSCPVCQGPTKIVSENDVETLYCVNPDCQAKKVKSFALAASRDALNIEGMSEATLEKFIGRGFIHGFADLFRLDRYRDEIVEMEGFGEKSYTKLIDACEKARETSAARVLYSLGIDNVGLSGAKLICKQYADDLTEIAKAKAEDLSAIDKIGPVIAQSVVDYFAQEKNIRALEELLSMLHIEKTAEQTGNAVLADLVFVITGSVEHYANRNELKAKIESLGGKVTGSVTSKTNYLINNDTMSSSSKNKKAKELGVAIISEEMFLDMIGESV